MTYTILVTGGAGLIGSHIVDHLLKEGHTVKILDALDKPTHLYGKPSYIPQEAQFFHGDTRDEKLVTHALADVDIVFHQAAKGGIHAAASDYISTNSFATAQLFEIIHKHKFPVKKVITASSVAVYGEGLYICPTHGKIHPQNRTVEQLEKGHWEVSCPLCLTLLVPQQTPEETPVNPETPYSLSKYDQEKITILSGKKYGIPVAALRYFLTYGPRQSLTNPYTGLCSIFSTQILNNKNPTVYEDGKQTRDFIFVEDVAAANLFVMHNKKAEGVFNVGTGVPTTIATFARTLCDLYNKPVSPNITAEFRPGDTRHIVADIHKLEQLGFTPKHTLKAGLKKYLDWIALQNNVQDYFSAMHQELTKTSIIRQKI
ncbi:MAG: NAD-dependent epimerase/dehydratase family protein [Nanoarchaeota archaeon]